MRAGIGAGLASGVALWVASPAVGVGWLAWVALVPAAAVAIRRADERAGRLAIPLAYGVALELMLIPALPFGLADGQFAHPPLPVLVGDSPVLPVALLLVPLFTAALYALRFGLPPRIAGVPPAVLAIAGPAIAWTALDLVRVKADPGGQWGPLFLTQHDTSAAGLAALAGPWILTAAIVAVNYALAHASRRAVAVAVAGAAAAVVGGAATEPASGDGERLTVAAIQPGYDTAEDELPVNRHFRPGEYDRAALDMVRDLTPLTREAAGRGAQLVVWPEAALWADPTEDALIAAALARVARGSDTTIVVPWFHRPRRQGATLIVEPDGRLHGSQPKQRPMWFLGEDGGNRRSARPERAGPGTIGTLLGVDVQDPAIARTLSDRGATVLTSSTHDWEQLAPQQRSYAQVMAAATDTPVVRADWRYGSAIYDAGGRRVAAAPGGKRRLVLVARVRPAAGRTAYARIGDVVGWAALALALGGVVARGGRKWRARRLPPAWTSPQPVPRP